MPAVTWLTDNDVKLYRDTLLDDELREMQAEIDKVEPGRWVIRQQEVKGQRRWIKPRTVYLYSLYAHIHSVEWQVINFAPRHGWDTAVEDDKPAIINYLNGYMSGLRAQPNMGVVG